MVKSVIPQATKSVFGSPLSFANKAIGSRNKKFKRTSVRCQQAIRQAAARLWQQQILPKACIEQFHSPFYLCHQTRFIAGAEMHTIP
jgi:hypothetical protein